jgi:hypothetical protein
LAKGYDYDGRQLGKEASSMYVCVRGEGGAGVPAKNYIHEHDERKDFLGNCSRIQQALFCVLH